jgi:cobaltochelatase CobT
VTRYYQRAVTISDPSELAGAMTDKLVELFEEKPATPNPRSRSAHRPAPRGPRRVAVTKVATRH